MGMHVLSYLKQTLKRKDKARDAEWDFGARQSPDASTRGDSLRRRRRSSSLDSQRHPPSAPRTEVPQQQQKRVSAAVGGDTRGPRGDAPAGARAKEPRSASPEDDVLMAAGESAKESRSAAKPSEQRRRAHSIAAARLTDPSGRPTLRHATSAFTARDIIPASPSPTPSRSVANSPAPSVQSFHSAQAGSSETNRRATLLVAKRSMPQLHNIWENFLEEAAENADSFDFPMPPRSPPQSPGKYATVHKSSRISGNPLPRQLHAPTASSSSVLTTASSASLSSRNPPRNAPSDPSQPLSPSSDRLRPRGHMRASHQTSSSTSSATTSAAGSTSSMAAFSSASSMTTAFDDSDDAPHGRDDPVHSTPQSSALSPRGFKFADPPLSPPHMQRLRKSPTSPALQYQTLPRRGSPTSSTSSESCSSSTASCSHSQSTTPTPSSACPTPSPSPSGPSPTFHSKHTDRLSLGTSSASRQHRRSPDRESLEYPLPPGSTKGSKSLSYRHSNATVGSRLELGSYRPSETGEGIEEYDEDVLSELGYYGSTSSRANAQERPPLPAFSAPSPQSTTSSGFPIVPPLRHSSRQNPHTAAAQSAPSAHAFSLPRAKSASNIKHDARAALERPRLSGTLSSSPLWTTKTATSSQPQSKAQIHARSQTLQHNPLQPTMDPNVNIGANSSAPVVSGPGQSRLRSGSASVVYSRRDAQAPVRPPPAPPLDMTPVRLQPPVESASPLTPAGAVQWGYAL